MKKFFSLKSILLLGVLVLLLIGLVPKWFIPETKYPIVSTNTEQQSQNDSIKLTAFKLPEEMPQPNLLHTNNFVNKSLLISDRQHKDIPDVWCIVFNSFATHAQAKAFIKKLEDNKIPAFIKDKEKYSLDTIMLSFKIQNEVIVGPEIDIAIIKKHLKKLEILGFKGKITKFNML